jgi:hypothetical protein
MEGSVVECVRLLGREEGREGRWGEECEPSERGEELRAGKGCVSVFLGLAGWGQQATAGSAASGPASCCASVRCRVGPLCWDRCFYRFPTHPRFTPEQLAEWVRNFLYIFMFSLFFRNKLQFEKIVETILLPVINCCQEIGLAIRCAAYVIKWRKLQRIFACIVSMQGSCGLHLRYGLGGKF